MGGGKGGGGGGGGGGREGGKEELKGRAREELSMGELLSLAILQAIKAGMEAWKQGYVTIQLASFKDCFIGG